MRTINRLLVANRGEIALRIMRTATDLGISTIAVYADQDMASPHTAEADEALALDGEDAATTYLNADKLLEAALATGADAIHPGYGFLSENADFARAVENAGIAWIGPSGDVIEALGDKISARKVAEACQVSPVPGVSAPITRRDEVEEFIAKHGFPVVLKRADGGGGRGITVLRSNADTDIFFARHQGSDLTAHFIERFVEVARHIETQCARDVHGNFRVVSTRDCSIQRRNQKLIEEAPAPFLPEGSNETLTDWSARLFEQVGYVGVGTCEFLLEPDGSIWFLEVNPRLQVEHPVTEEVAGVDLVREQIRIAEQLPLSEPVAMRGHSFEFRITSEDPSADLTPAAGRLDEVHWPTGPGIRLDLGIDQGDSVQTAFDSMIAKIIVTGADRDQALARSRRALAEFSVQGVATPVPVYQDIIEDPAFIGAGGFTVSTRWLETDFLPRHDYSALADPASAQDTRELPRQTYVIELDGRRMTLTLPQGMFSVPPASRAVRPTQPLRSARQEARASLGRPTSTFGAEPGAIVSPMQATIVQLLIQPGDLVQEGQLIAVLEAMKMEKPILAPLSGRISHLGFSQGDTVAAGDLLIRIESEEA
ncbi:biotin carboxylase N-terminal domain-containing protein [Schaalia vaccimaxillae]|uniref:ATP-binding protein n=1 Tax=Schaalia vaccimaxillae TaxID=183916 RepID=UPI0003B42174|nr:biotin carboxylase N-terminal domain-containing protein [Schaalia vaccimaxillae]